MCGCEGSRRAHHFDDAHDPSRGDGGGGGGDSGRRILVMSRSADAARIGGCEEGSERVERSLSIPARIGKEREGES